jgi:drug/metabolite transporter (DMT)-like permease
VDSSYDPAAVAEWVTEEPPAAAGVTGSPHGHPLLGVGLVFTAATLFAVNGTISKLVLTNGLSSLRLVEIRCVAAAAIFALIAARRPATLRLSLRESGFIVVYGVVGLAMVQWLYFVSIARMPVSVSLLIEFTAPLMVALWVRYVRHEPVRQRVWVSLGLCLGGLVLVARVWAGLTLDGIGLLTAGLAAVSLATYYLLGERGLGSRDPFSLAAWSFGAAGLFWSLLLPWWTFPADRLGGSVQVGSDGPHVLVGVLVAWVIVLGTVAPFGLVLLGLRLIGAARTGLVGTVEPVLAGFIAWVVLGERLAPVQVLGAAVVMAGIVVAESARAPRPTAAAPVAAGLAP